MRIAFFFIAIAFQVAQAQVEHGSVGIIYFTNEKIVMAGDSRALAEGRPPDDTQCKVSAPGGQILFTSVGVGGDVGTPKSPAWTNTEEAHRAYERVASRYSTALGHTPDIAQEWAISIQSRFLAQYALRPQEVIRNSQRGRLSVALIGGRSANGDPELFQVEITVNPSNTRPIGWEIGKIPNCPLQDFCVLGLSEIAVEFLGLTSERAREEARTWTAPTGSTAEVYDILRAVRLVELTIQYQLDDIRSRQKSVGGKIDVAQLNRTGPVRWYARKKNCPAN